MILTHEQCEALMKKVYKILPDLITYDDFSRWEGLDTEKTKEKIQANIKKLKKIVKVLEAFEGIA